MMTPLLAMPAATRAIWRGVAATSCWPMADLASPGWSWAKELAGGKEEAAANGRSMGGTLVKPNDWAPADSLSPPRSRPSWAKAVLHETWRATGRGPPQDSPPKFRRVWPPALGRGSSVRLG